MPGPEIQAIFTTAYREYALKGFELAATDYPLKPINFTRFLKACQLAETRCQVPAMKKREEEQALFVKDGHNWVQIKFSNLVYAKRKTIMWICMKQINIPLHVLH